MRNAEIEQRLRKLEAELAELRAKVNRSDTDNRQWWEEIAETFADDPAFDEAMKLGRKYRESLKPKRKKRRNGHSCHRSHHLDFSLVPGLVVEDWTA
jgi:hypothetical protein